MTQDHPEFFDHRRHMAATVLIHLLDRLVREGAPESEAVLDVMCAAIDEMGAGAPQVSLLQEKVRSDATWWADCASTVELEAYTAASLRALAQKNFAPAARKRLLVMLWEGLSATDRRAFLAAVDPAGKFRGKAA